MEWYINKADVVAEIEKCYNECLKRAKIVDADYWNGCADAYRNVLAILDDTLEVKEVEEEPVSNDLEEAARKAGQEYFPNENNIWARPNYEAKKAECAFKAGAQWQKEQMITKACVFLESTDFYKYYNREFIKEFKKAMKE